MQKRDGVRHIDRLANAILEVLEDKNVTPELRLDAGKTLFAVLERRNNGKRKKTPGEKAIEQMLGTAKPKGQFPYVPKPRIPRPPRPN